jgi:hypothetical protein
MDLRVQVSTAIFNDSETKIGVGCFEQGGEYDAAGGDSVKHERVDLIGAKDHGEIGAGKGTDPMFGDNNFALLRANDRWDRAERLLK